MFVLTSEAFKHSSSLPNLSYIDSSSLLDARSVPTTYSNGDWPLSDVDWFSCCSQASVHATNEDTALRSTSESATQTEITESEWREHCRQTADALFDMTAKFEYETKTKRRASSKWPYSMKMFFSCFVWRKNVHYC